MCEGVCASAHIYEKNTIQYKEKLSSITLNPP